MKKNILFSFAPLLLIFIIWLNVSPLHSGGTDWRGGHYDHDSGEYHYHHGYPAHNHYDMDGDGDIDCPYKIQKDDPDVDENKTTTTVKKGQTNDKEQITHYTAKRFWKFIAAVILLYLPAYYISCFLATFYDMARKYITHKKLEDKQLINITITFAIILDVVVAVLFTTAN